MLLSLTKLILANITKHILQISLTNGYLCNMLTADNAYIADILILTSFQFSDKSFNKEQPMLTNKILKIAQPCAAITLEVNNLHNLCYYHLDGENITFLIMPEITTGGCNVLDSG